MAARLTVGTMQGLADRLVKVPAPERPLSVADALARLAPALRKMQSRGHTLDSIRVALAAEGLQVSARAIRTAIGKPKTAAVARRQASEADTGMPEPAVPAGASRARQRAAGAHGNAQASDAAK